jgi:hypothetical protein
MLYQNSQDAIQYGFWLPFATGQSTHPKYDFLWVANEKAKIAVIMVPEGYISTTFACDTEVAIDIVTKRYAGSTIAFIGFMENGEDKSFFTLVGIASERDMALIRHFKEIIAGKHWAKYRFISGRVLLKSADGTLDLDRDLWRDWKDLVDRTRESNFSNLPVTEFPWKVRLTRANVNGNKDIRNEDTTTWIEDHPDKDYVIPVFWYTRSGTELKVSRGDIAKMNWRTSIFYRLWRFAKRT